MKVELVTTLKRKATEILASLKDDKEPILITQHGKPSAYLVDVQDYESLMMRLSILEGIAKGERAIENQQTTSNHDAKDRLQRWLK